MNSNNELKGKHKCEQEYVMNILIHRYNSICEPDYIDAFKAIGISVIEDNVEMICKSTPVEDKVKILGEMILTHRPLFVFSINFFPYIAMVCEKLQCLYVCVSVDCPVVELFSVAIKSKYNRVFLFDYAQYVEVREFNPDCIFHMPLGVNVNRIDNTIGSYDGHKVNYKYGVSFVGSLYSEKDRLKNIMPKLSKRMQGYCSGLLAAQSMFNGQEIIENAVSDELIKSFKDVDKEFYPSDMSLVNTDRFVVVNNYLSFHLTSVDRTQILNEIANKFEMHLFTTSDTSDLRNVICHGAVSSLQEMPRVFRQSKINLNTTMRTIRTGLSQRIWDVLGCGGFLLTNYQSEIPENLEIGKHLVAYESIEEACELIDYFLSHDDEREEIARQGYEYVKANHTVINRVNEMIRIINNTLC